MTLEQILCIIPYDERIEIDKHIRGKEVNYFEELFFGRKMYFDYSNFANAKVQMISSLPDAAGRTLYIVIE